MTEAPPIIIANAVAFEINARGWAPFSPVVEMSHADWLLPMEESNVLRIDVVPTGGSNDLDQGSQGTFETECPVDVMIRKRFSEDSDTDSATGRIKTASVNDLVGLLFDVAKYFMPAQPSQDGRRLRQVKNAAWIETRMMSIRSAKMLKDHRQYEGFFRVKYRLTEAPA